VRRVDHLHTGRYRLPDELHVGRRLCEPVGPEPDPFGDLELADLYDGATIIA